MGFRFICPSTGHEIEAKCQVDDEDRTEKIISHCSFCGGLHVWVFVEKPTSKDADSSGLRQQRAETIAELKQHSRKDSNPKPMA
jgi:transcription elongation factor Elf1